MAIAIGLKSAVCIAKEGTWGTLNDTWTNWLRFRKCTIQSKESLAPRQNLYGSTGQGHEKSFIGRVTCGGVLEVEASYVGIGVLLDMVMGTSSSSGTTAPYTHTYDPNAGGTLDGYSMRVLRGTGTEETFEGLKADTWRLYGSSENQVMLEVNVVGQKSGESRAANGTTSPTLTDNNLIKTSHAGTISWNGNTYTVESFELSGNNKLAKRHLCGSQYIAEPVVAGMREWRLKFTGEKVTDADNLFDDNVANTIADLTWTFTGAGNEQMTITGKNAQLYNLDEPLDSEGIQKVSAEFLFHGTSAAFDCVVEIQNDESSATAN